MFACFLYLGQPLSSLFKSAFKNYAYSWFLELRDGLLLFLVFLDYSLKVKAQEQFKCFLFWKGYSVVETESASNLAFSQGKLNPDPPVSTSQVMK